MNGVDRTRRVPTRGLEAAARASVLLPLVLAVGCGDPGAPPFYIGTGGSGGSGASGTGATAGNTGTGGTAGTGGTGSSGGAGGTGAMNGTGGTAGTGGTGSSGGSAGPCVTSALCHTCPNQFLCDTDDDCAFSGYVCVASGCETHQGASIKQCQPLHGGSCDAVTDCPNSIDYACSPIGAGPDHCVRVTPGCTGATESYDCLLGFSCEAGACVDRRVPCDTYEDCPKNHVCKFGPTSSFCVRVYQTCHEDVDCAGFGSLCANVDGDSPVTKECVGEFSGPDDPCINSSCASSSAPVCESGVTGTTASCGDYGLCLSPSDCDNGFSCVGLWQDGRKECVPTGGTCDQVTDCPLQQVCAAPRSGGSPRCQAGKEAM